MFENISNKISSLKIIPVVKLWDSLQAVKLAEALVSGGINAMEITFRTVEGNEGVPADRILLRMGMVGHQAECRRSYVMLFCKAGV